MSSVSDTAVGSRPLFLADHTALDFINTIVQVDGEPRDLFQSDSDVGNWLMQAGFTVLQNTKAFKPGKLLHEARQLRETIRILVEQKKAGKPVDCGALNRYLATTSSYIQLVSDEAGALRTERVYANPAPPYLPGLLVEQAASLIADPHFELVRECEHPECSLWFYDRTKSHRRRWCSMALCGNRAKVARFRQQQK